MPTIEELNLQKEALVKQKKLRDERFEENIEKAQFENKDKYNSNVFLSKSEIQKMRDDHNEKMHKEFGEKIEEIDKEIINTLQDNIKRSNEEMEKIKTKIEEKDNEMKDVEAEAKTLENEYNHALTSAFHGENEKTSEDYNRKKAELTTKTEELTKQRESLLRELSNYEINIKTMEYDLDTRLRDMPDAQNINSQKKEEKPGTYDKDGRYIMTPEEEKSWREFLDDEDSIENLLENEYNSFADNNYEGNTEVNTQRLNNDSISRSNDEQKSNSDILIKNGRMFLDLGYGKKDFKMLLGYSDINETNAQEIVENATEGKNALFTVQELAEMLSNSNNKNDLNVNSKWVVFKYAADLNEIDKNVIANIINYYKGALSTSSKDDIKTEIKNSITKYLDTVRNKNASIKILVDLKDKNGWKTTNKDMTNYYIIKNWAYKNKDKDWIDIITTRRMKLLWKIKDFINRKHNKKEALPPVKEKRHRRLSDLSVIEETIEKPVEEKVKEKVEEEIEEPIEEVEEKVEEIIEKPVEVNGETKKGEEYYDELLNKVRESEKENEAHLVKNDKTKKGEEYYDNLLSQVTEPKEKNEDNDIDM